MLQLTQENIPYSIWYSDPDIRESGFSFSCEAGGFTDPVSFSTNGSCPILRTMLGSLVRIRVSVRNLGGSKILIDLRSINIFEEGYHMAADQSRWSDAFRIEIHFYTGAIDRLSIIWICQTRRHLYASSVIRHLAKTLHCDGMFVWVIKTVNCQQFPVEEGEKHWRYISVTLITRPAKIRYDTIVCI